MGLAKGSQIRGFRLGVPDEVFQTRFFEDGEGFFEDGGGSSKMGGGSSIFRLRKRKNPPSSIFGAEDWVEDRHRPRGSETSYHQHLRKTRELVHMIADAYFET